MKKLFAPLVSVAVLALPILGGAQTYYVAGAFQGWDPAASPMSETSAGSGIWTETFTGVTPGRYEFKVTQGDWNWTYPGANSWVYVPGSGSITITYDVNNYADGWSSTTQRLGESADPGTWTAAGDFQGWDNSVANMTSIGAGIYEYTVTTPGSHSWKAVVTGSSTWDSISWDNRSINTANWDFTVGDGEQANLYVNALAGTTKLEIVTVPEPSTLALLGCGVTVGLGWLRRRQ